MQHRFNKLAASSPAEFDYVIIGAGSAGSAIAYRLGEDKSISIALIEYGGSDAGPFIQMPAALSYPMNMRFYDWGYRAVAEPALNGRSLVCPRGKVIGGSSSINGMIYVRGHAGDYDHWQAQGASGWSYADILPYFKKMETALNGAAEMGPCILPAASNPTRCITPLCARLDRQDMPLPPIIMASARRGLARQI